MGLKKVRVEWAAKLLKARYFVVLTDRESAIMFDGVDMTKSDDRMVLAAQRAELQLFQSQIAQLIKSHDIRIKALGGGTKRATTKNASNNTTSPQGRGATPEGKVSPQVRAVKKVNKKG